MYSSCVLFTTVLSDPTLYCEFIFVEDLLQLLDVYLDSPNIHYVSLDYDYFNIDRARSSSRCYRSAGTTNIDPSYSFLSDVLNVLSRRRHTHQSISKEALEHQRNYVRYVLHEVRTPLNTAYLGLKILQDKFSSPTWTEIVSGEEPEENTSLQTTNEVYESFEAAMRILNEILLYEKVRARLLKLDLERLSPVTFLKEAVRPFFIQVRGRNVNTACLPQY